MPAFNRALALVPLPSSNIMLGIVFGHDFLYRQALQTDKQLLVFLSAFCRKGLLQILPLYQNGYMEDTERAPFFSYSPVTELSLPTERTKF